MDPFTQGVVGAVAAQQKAKNQNILMPAIFGFFAGMAADLDVLIRSPSDPILALEFHRQFTHSLIFIPIGGLICALFFYYVFAKKLNISFWQIYLFSSLGYLTHAFIDSCTSYGTQLFWPFSDYRVSFDIISIIDPLFTIPLFILVILAIIKKAKIFSRLAILWIFVYLVFGYIQHERAIKIGQQLALDRGHKFNAIEAKPSFANLLVWKIIYSTDKFFYVDAVRVGFGEKIFTGSKIEKLNIEKSFPWLDKNSQQYKDIERFKWFSDGYVAVSNKFANRIIDIRYSMAPNEIRGLWGIEIHKQANNKEHVIYVFNRSVDNNRFDTLWKMLVK